MIALRSPKMLNNLFLLFQDDEIIVECTYDTSDRSEATEVCCVNRLLQETQIADRDIWEFKKGVLGHKK